MATTSSLGVGGKIVKNKRLRKTPYSRPFSTTNEPENPNWLSGFIYPAKFIASGAGKILSFFGNDDDDDDDSTSSSENEDDDDEIENDMSFREDDQLDKVLSISSKSDNKRAIEQLVMRETYSRKEAYALIKLVRSRIMDTGGNIGETTPNMCTTAIMEAKKWLQEKRSGSKIQLENELDVSNVASSSQLKKSSFTSGSWNLLDEIRRVRSKATEELLAAAPLTKTTLSSYSTENNQPQHTLMNKRVAEGSGLAESTHDRSENKRDASANDPSRVSQDKDAVQSVELQDSEEADVSKYNDNEVEQLKNTAAENGFNCSASGVAEGEHTNEAQPSEEENGNLVDLSGHDIDMENVTSQEEPAIDIATDNFINGSLNSSSMQEEDLSQDFSLTVAKDGPLAKTNDTKKERKSRGRGPTRRGRGRGK